MPKPIICVLADPAEPPPAFPTLTDRVDLRVASRATLTDQLSDAEGLLLWDFFSPALRHAWSAAHRLDWIHVTSAGVDSLLFPALIDSDVVVTNARGIFDRPIAEYVLGAVLAHAKQTARSLDLQREQQWQHRELVSVLDQRAMIIGTGSIGRAVARLLRAAGLAVSGAGRTARTGDPDFGDVIASDQLVHHVGEVDHLIMVAPLTTATTEMINASVLAAMKPTAHLINVGRGRSVDEAALLAALTEARIGGATLDVVTEEPLPAGHPLWQAPGVVITPHLSGDVIGWRDRLAAQFVDNAERWLAGTPLQNVIDKRLGFAAPPSPGPSFRLPADPSGAAP